jgi:Brp/Blh family beta-carotene 15,15'-monooxygenase
MLQVLLGWGVGEFQFLPLMLGMLLFGLPHGAIDHLVALGLAGKGLRPMPFAVVTVAYLLLVVAVLGLWVCSPIAAAVGFLAMTIWHWGKGDIAFERCVLNADVKFRGRLADGVHLVTRGLIPISLPLVAFPEEATDFLSACVKIFAPAALVEPGQWRLAALSLFAFFFIADCLWHLRHGRQALARRVLMENICLAGFFAHITPLVAIGWYFAGWHGFRHVIRLSGYVAGDTRSDMPFRNKIGRTIRQALPFTVVSLLMLVGLRTELADRIMGTSDEMALYLVLVSALTVPHLVVVEWMDRSEFALRSGRG